MSGVFQNIDPPPSHRPACVYPHPAFGAGGGHTRWVERGVGGGSIFWKTPDTALYSTYAGTLWGQWTSFSGLMTTKTINEVQTLEKACNLCLHCLLQGPSHWQNIFLFLRGRSYKAISPQRKGLRRGWEGIEHLLNRLAAFNLVMNNLILPPVLFIEYTPIPCI